MSGENGTGDSITKQDVNPNGSYRIFWAVVQGTKGGDGSNFNTNYTLTIGGDINDVVEGEIVADDSKGNGGKKVTFKNDSTISQKHITVTATAAGKADAPVTWEILVDGTVVVITGPDFSNAQWVIKNTVQDRGRDIDSQTTKALEVKNGRYEVFNNEPGATIDNQPVLGGNAFRDVTIMYLNVPIPADSEGFIPFGIQARIRVTGHRTTPVFGQTGDEQWGSGRQALVMGYINDPTASDFGQTFASTDAEAATTTPDKAPFFHGFRILSSGQHRFYGRRPGTGGYGSAQLSPTASANDKNEDIPGTTTKYQAQLELHDYVNGSLVLNTAKKEGFMDQEYVVKVVRSGASMHYFEVYDSSGENMLFSCHPTGGSNYPGAEMTGISNYLAFLVYGVKAEISDIKVFYDDQQVWEDSAVKGATPLPTTAKRVDITVNGGTKVQLPGYPEDYSVLGDQFPTTGVPVTAEVVPLTLADKSVDWTKSGDGPLAYDEGAMWKTGTTFGTNTLTATAKNSSVSKSVTFNLVDPASIILPTSLTINSSLDELLYGRNVKDKATLTVDSVPNDAIKQVVWTVTAGDSAVTLDAVNGTIKAKKVATDTEVTIKATSSWAPTVSTTKTITVKGDDGVREWTFGAGTLSPWSFPAVSATNLKLTIDYGLTVNPESSTTMGRWMPDQKPGTTALDALYTGAFAANAGGTFGEIDLKGQNLSSADGSDVELTLVWTHTGNGAPDDVRKLWVKFDDGAASENTITNADNLANGSNSGWVVDNAYYKVTGKGDKVTFGSSGATRIYAVIVKVIGGAVIPDPVTSTWLFNATTATAAGLTETSPGTAAGESLWNITTNTAFGTKDGATLTLKQGNAGTQIRANQGSGGITGCLQLGGTPYDWGEITGITGEFSITLKCSATGGTNWNRNPTVKVGTGGTVTVFECVPASADTAPSGVTGTSLGTVTKTFTAAAGDTIFLSANQTIRIYEVTITK
jgi:hypothetical protein